MKNKVLKVCADGGKLLTSDALEYILDKDDPVAFTSMVLKKVLADKMFVNKKDLLDVLVGDSPLETPKTALISPKRTISDIRVYKDSDITGESRSEGDIKDFLTFFKNRYYTTKDMIEARPDFQRAIDISIAKTRTDANREHRIIGVVDGSNVTRNGHTLLTISDMSDVLKVLIPKDSPLKSQSMIDDEVVGLVGKFNNERTLFIPSRIVRPITPRKTWEKSDTSSKVAFISDIHVGSNTFLTSQWEAMIKWIKENHEKECINYIVFPGDVVDGIGIYPGQENELIISDIYEQYTALGEHLKEIPDDIKMILQPGNHDAVRLAEPQPALPSVFTKNFDSNVMMVGNPVSFEIEGRVITSYHGKSLDDWIADVPRLTYDRPIEAMKEMCMRRHLGPKYGGKNQISPENRDYLIMNYVPDIFVTGHVHKIDSGMYNGIRLLNASTFQDQTTFQKQHNFNPTPSVVPIVSLSDGHTRLQDFNQ